MQGGKRAAVGNVRRGLGGGGADGGNGGRAGGEQTIVFEVPPELHGKVKKESVLLAVNKMPVRVPPRSYCGEGDGIPVFIYKIVDVQAYQLLRSSSSITFPGRVLTKEPLSACPTWHTNLWALFSA